MQKKKRAPIEELRRAKEIADKLLIERKLMLPHDQSALARIFKTKDGPVLPGLPAYLPFPWTINATRRVLYDIALIWRNEVKKDRKRGDNISEFFRFVIAGLEKEQSKIRKAMQKSELTLEYDLTLLQKKDVASGITKFLVDSFAVSIIEKANGDVPEYMEWFLRWTDSLLNQWDAKIRYTDANKELQAGQLSQIQENTERGTQGG